MKKSIKRSLIIIAVALLACFVGLVWFGSQPHESDESIGMSVADTSQGPAFEVRVVMPGRR